MRTSLRLAALLTVLSLPFVPVHGAGAQQAPAGEAGCTVIDATGDTFRLDTSAPHADPRADITHLCVDYRWSLRVVVAVASHTSPATDPGWGASGDSGIELRFDTGGDDQPELAVLADGSDDPIVRNPASGTARCVAQFFALPSAYAIEISRVCLNSDTVRVRALMVYDPAPNPNPGPLIGDRAPDAGFVPTATRAAPAAPPPLAGPAPACAADEANDTIDESFAPVVFDAGDIVEGCVQHSDTQIRLTQRMARPTDPQTDSLWLPATLAAWDVDVNNDTNEDFTVVFSAMGARVFASDASGPADSCAGTPGFDGTNLIAVFPRACLGNPQFLAARPLAIFARTAQVEPQPPVALDLFRFPGYGPIVGAPGVTVPVQATRAPSGSPSTTTPRTGVTVITGTGGGIGSGGGTTGGGSPGGGTRTTTGGGGNQVVATSTASSGSGRTGALAFTGLVFGLVPAAGGLGALAVGAAMVLASRRRPRAEPGRWDLLPGDSRSDFDG